MNSRESKKFEKLTERFQALSDEELLCEYEKTAILSARQYYEMIERGKAKSLGLEMSAISHEFMRRGIVEKIETFFKSDNLAVRAHAVSLVLIKGSYLLAPQLVECLEGIRAAHQDRYASMIAESALEQYDFEKFIKEST